MKIYFAGGESASLVQILQSEGVKRALFSFANKDIRMGADKLDTFEEVLLDSGAFAEERSVVTPEYYALWLRLHLDRYKNIVGYFNLDDMDSLKQSIANFDYLCSEGLKPIPVYHYGEPDEVLDAMASKHEYVGLGGIAVGSYPTKVIRSWWEGIAKRYPAHRFHLLGTNAMELFWEYQPFSLDNTSWVKNEAFGITLLEVDGKPTISHMLSRREGIRHFFTRQEVLRNNVRATLHWETLEWLSQYHEERARPRQVGMFGSAVNGKEPSV